MTDPIREDGALVDVERPKMEPEFGKWMPIETVPEWERVLVYCPINKTGDPSCFVHVFEAKAEQNGFFYDPVYSEWDGSGATHWMPLPEPPK